MEGKLKIEKYNIDTDGSLKKELDIIENLKNQLITKGSKEVVINKVKPQDIETKTIEIEGTGNFIGVKNSIINIPLEMIVFPFFTNQKQKRNVNFEYKFTDVGITMRSKLSSFDKEDKVYQPSLLEKKIYNFLIIMYEKNIENGITHEYIEFEVSDFIENFLGNKMNSQYYVKVEQALKNLKYTQYEFLIDNHKKAGKLKFESPRFYLLDYSKIKLGKRVQYRVSLNSNIINKIIEKRYIKYDSKNLMEITDKDSVADRIYEFISMKRFNTNKGSEKVEVLAGIIPLQTVKINKRKNKDGKVIEYKTSNMSYVRRRVKQAFEALKELGYILNFNEVVLEGKRYQIEYEFNTAKDNVAHISSYLSNPNNQKMKLIHNVETDSIDNKNPYPKLLKELEHTKRNIFFAKKFNARSQKMFERLCNEEGEEFMVEVLKRVYQGLHSDIKKTLSAYVRGVIKNVKAESAARESRETRVEERQMFKQPEFAEVIEVVEEQDKEEVNETKPLKGEKEEISIAEDTLFSIYLNFSQSKKDEIEEKAKELYAEDLGAPLSPINIKIFNNDNVKKLYVRRVLKEMFGL